MDVPGKALVNTFLRQATVEPVRVSRGRGGGLGFRVSGGRVYRFRFTGTAFWD